MDVVNSNVYNTIDENIEGSTLTENKYEQYLRGQGTQADRRVWSQNTREYIIPFQRGSILNCNALLPLFRMSDLHIELWNADGRDVLHSPLGDQTCSFVMSDMELHANYLSSKSISSYYATRPVQFTINDVSHRYNNVVGQTALLKFSSSHSSLNRIITLLRSSDNLGVNIPSRASRGVSGYTIDKFQLLVNSVRYYDVDVDSIEQMFGHFKSAFKSVGTSTWYDHEYAGTKFLLCNNLTSAPSDFAEHIQSGVKTSAHNSDCALQIQFVVPPVNIVADSFLLSDGTITLPTGKSDLTLSY
jgi:hypothetical protein